MNQAVFITGASGFLGTQVTRLILEQTNRQIIVLVRAKDLTEAAHRLERIWWDWPKMVGEIGNRIQIANGDLCLPRFGLSEITYRELISKVSHIIHLAADIRLDEPIDTLRQINTEGVGNVLKFAHEIHRIHGLTRLSYVSTAYVAGKRKGRVPESELTDRYGFSNHYELSKYEGESLVREAGTVLPVTIFRPGMIIGDSKTGAIKTFNTLYFPLRLYLTGKLKFLPVEPTMKINMVPCDYVSEAIVKLTFDPEAKGLNFHLTLPADSLPNVREMLEYTRIWAKKELHVSLPAPVFLPLSISRCQRFRSFFREKSAIRSLLSVASYFEEDRIYQRENLDRLFGEYQENWHSFFPHILTYGCSRGFMHRSERTVQEQAYYRLSSKSRPVTFRDVIPGKTISRSGEIVKREIEMIASAMSRMGIRQGDRIAVVGFNSSRYFAIDTAIGLIGAVSVPLYYSSPLRELLEIMEDCQARMFFVGVPELLEKLAAADIKVPMVSFCREQAASRLPDHIKIWQDFLALGEEGKPASQTAGSSKSTVSFSDIATLRYTSGTTGRPKGAAFDHASLRSMAETMASLPPWHARTKKIVYLSFLPMNHVVEGILAAYSIHYTPAPVDTYYLENFRDLQNALPKIRPTVFFSVPRFYEKVWDSAERSLLGRWFIKSRNSLMKGLLGRFLGIAIKKKAGIGRCAQLIVGSAPVSAGLLENFRSIGIEIHNAYGLTEAPLITLNRAMANRIGTVGEPLPETQIRIAEDGEVMVKGPQVMKGCDWLCTGDYGFLNNDSYLVISGRKKELIVDSYGKNINPVKVELLLREATGIDQILLCGDQRPYCTALLFGCNSDDKAFQALVENRIKEVNQQLSHPEQVKKWALLKETLSIEEGELTANLKMKRNVIAFKYKKVLESLYDEGVLAFRR